jgi:hypothetical protein
MSTRVTASTRISAACRELVNQRLNIALDSAIDFAQVNAVLDAGRIDLPSFQGLLANGEVSGILSTLAPAPFARACDILAGLENEAGNRSELLAARVQLADAMAAASSVIDGATRDVTADAFAEAGAELRYTVSLCRGPTATGVELRHANEVMLLRIHDGGSIECDHAGLVDETCGNRQRELEEAVARRGVVLTGRKQRHHGSYTGGELISNAVSRGDPILARATVTDAGQAALSSRDHRLFSPASAAEASQRSRGMRRGGGS